MPVRPFIYQGKDAAKLLALKTREGLTKRSCKIIPSLFITILSFLAITPLLCFAPVQAGSVRLLVSGAESYYRETQTSFTDCLLGLSPDTIIRVTVVDDNTSAAGEPPPWSEDIVVTIGTLAAEFAQKVHTGKTLNLFLTNGAWQRLANDSQKPQTAAVILDQAPHRIMLLAQILAPQARHVATVLSPGSGQNQNQLKRTAKGLKLSLDTEILREKDDPITLMSPLIENNDVFIALPDSATFNRATAKWVLYLAYRSNTPVIGFSKAYTDAGALASIYSSPSNIGRHGAEMTATALTRQGKLEAGLHSPRYFTLRTNPSVANALNIELPDDAALYRMYEAALAQTQ